MCKPVTLSFRSQKFAISNIVLSKNSKLLVVKVLTQNQKSK